MLEKKDIIYLIPFTNDTPKNIVVNNFIARPMFESYICFDDSKLQQYLELSFIEPKKSVIEEEKIPVIEQEEDGRQGNSNP